MPDLDPRVKCPNCGAGPDAILPYPHIRNPHRVACVTCGEIWSLPPVEVIEQMLEEPGALDDLPEVIRNLLDLGDDPDLEPVLA